MFIKKKKLFLCFVAAGLLLLLGCLGKILADSAVFNRSLAQLGMWPIFLTGLFEKKDESLARFIRYLYAAHDYGVENVKLQEYLKKHPSPLSDESFREALKILTETELYIRQFDKKKYIEDGLKRITSPEGRYDYIPQQIENLFRKYRYVDRRRVLAGIFHKIVGEEKDHTRRHELVLDFLAKGIFHSLETQPLNRDGSMVYDPIVLLEFHSMMCGNINRIACDLFSCIGYKARAVQLSGHVIGEIYYDSTWHYFDADTVLNANSIVKINGVIPDTKTLSKNPHLLDKNDIYQESYFNHSMAWSPFYPGVYVFRFKSGEYPLYYVKTATPIQELNEYYGWNYYSTVKAEDIAISSTTEPCPSFQPSLTFVDNISLCPGKVSLSCRAIDNDSDLLGYRLFISTQSRGWDYNRYFCGEDVKKYIRPRPELDPAAYDRINRMPSSEVALVESDAKGKFDLSLPRGTYFMTIMAFDRHGEKIGKRWYTPSNELVISVP